MVPPAGSSPLGAIGRGWTYLADNWRCVKWCKILYKILYKILVQNGSNYLLVELERFVKLEEGDVVGDNA